MLKAFSSGTCSRQQFKIVMYEPAERDTRPVLGTPVVLWLDVYWLSPRNAKPTIMHNGSGVLACTTSRTSGLSLAVVAARASAALFFRPGLAQGLVAIPSESR